MSKCTSHNLASTSIDILTMFSGSRNSYILPENQRISYSAEFCILPGDVQQANAKRLPVMELFAT